MGSETNLSINEGAPVIAGGYVKTIVGVYLGKGRTAYIDASRHKELLDMSKRESSEVNVRLNQARNPITTNPSKIAKSIKELHSFSNITVLNFSKHGIGLRTSLSRR